MDCLTVFYSVYLHRINAVVAFQAGQLTDPEYRAIPSPVAAVVAMAGGIPVILQFHPHEEVSYRYMILLCFHFASVCIYRFFPVSDTVLWIRIGDPVPI
jgi:hypothetical protein